MSGGGTLLPGGYDRTLIPWESHGRDRPSSTAIDRTRPTGPIDRARPVGPTDSTRPLRPTETIRPTRPTDAIRPTKPTETIRPTKPTENVPKPGKTGLKPSASIGVTRDENGNLSLGGSAGTNFGPIGLSIGTTNSIGLELRIPTPAPGLGVIVGVSINPLTGELESVTGGVSALGLVDVTVTIEGCTMIVAISLRTPSLLSIGYGQRYLLPDCVPKPPPLKPGRGNGRTNPIDFDPGFPGLDPREEEFLKKIYKGNPGCGVVVQLVRYWTTYTYQPLNIFWQESRDIVENLGDGWLQRTFPGQGPGNVAIDAFEGGINISPPSQWYPDGYISLVVGGGYGSVDMRAWMAAFAEYRGIDYYFSYSAKDYYYLYSGMPPYGYANNYPDFAANPYRLKGVRVNCGGDERVIPYPGYSEDRVWNPPLRDLPLDPPTRLNNNEDDMGNCECACASLRLLREIHEVLNPAQIKAFVAPVCPDPTAPSEEPEAPPEPYIISDYPSLMMYLLMQFCNIGESNINKALGFPFMMPRHLNATVLGDDLGEVLGVNIVKIENLSDLYKNWIEIFDGIVGEFPVKLEVVTDENQTAPLEFTTIADALADIGSLNVATAYDADNTFSLLIKVMLQVLKTNSLSHQTYDLMHLTNEQLGFRIKQKPFKQKLPIDPRFPDDWVKFNQEWEPEEDNCLSFDNDDKDTLKGILILIQEAVAIIKSANTISATPDKIVGRIKALAQIVQLGRQLGLGETLAEVLGSNWQSTLESFQRAATAAAPEIKVTDSEGQAPPATP